MRVAEAAPPAASADPLPPVDAPSPRWRRIGPRQGLLPVIPLAGSVLFNLSVLRAELSGTQNLNDSSVHLAMVRWAMQRIQDGHSPLDGWFPDLALGSPLFHSYQTLPHIVTGLLATVFGADRTFHWVLYLLLSCWPLAIYASVRLLGWDKWTAAAAGVVSPLIVGLPGYGYEHGAYTWRGSGVWSQLFGMWLLPLALALGWRAIHEGRTPVLAGVVLGLTIVCHLLTGYVAIVGLTAWVLAAGWPRLLPRVARAGLVLLGGLVAASYLLVPLMLDSGFAAQSEFLKGTSFNNSYGARKILGWLISGRLFDNGRWPVLTVLVMVGAGVCAARARHDIRARGLLLFEVISLMLFFGRSTWGPALRVLPGSPDLLFHRFVLAVDLGGIWLAGVGGAWLAQTAVAGIRRVRPDVRVGLAGTVAACLGAALLLPAWTERASFDRRGATLISFQETAELTDGAAFDRLLSRMATLPPGRVYAGKLGNWGRQYRIGQVPACTALLNRRIDSVGFVLRILSLTSDIEARFDDTNPFQYQVLGIRYLVLPSDHPPTVPATLIDRQGRHTLWSVNGVGGYLQVADTTGTVTADRVNIAARTAGVMAQRTLGSPYMTVDFPGHPAAPPTSAPGDARPGAAGVVETDVPAPDDGV
ncbi:MAG: hypothetical protein QOI86_5010, partial [Actinomycetota bacterium]|nr:hypothetical protein [Actinomycetota bacterium]